MRETYATIHPFEDGIPGRCFLFGARVRYGNLYRYSISTHCIGTHCYISTHCKLGLWGQLWWEQLWGEQLWWEQLWGQLWWEQLWGQLWWEQLWGQLWWEQLWGEQLWLQQLW